MFQQVYNGNIMETAKTVNHDLAKINKGDKKWLICINTKNIVVMLISRQVTWTSHINNITRKIDTIKGMLTRYKYVW